MQQYSRLVLTVNERQLDRKLIDEYTRLVHAEQQEQDRVHREREKRRSKNAVRLVRNGMERARVIDESLRRRHGTLLDEVLAVLAYRDPLGYGVPPHDVYLYTIEARKMLDELAAAPSLASLKAIIYRHFVASYGKVAEGRERYETLSEDIWEILQERRIRQMDG